MKLFFTILFLLISVQCFSQEILKREKIEIIETKKIHNVFNIDNDYYVALTDRKNNQYILKYDNNFENPNIIKQFTLSEEYIGTLSDNYFQFYNNQIQSILWRTYLKGYHYNHIPQIISIDIYGNEIKNIFLNLDISDQAYGSSIIFKFINSSEYFVYFPWFYSDSLRYHAFNYYINDSTLKFKKYIEEIDSIKHIEKMLNIDYKDDLFHFYGVYENNDDDSTKIVHLKYNDKGEKVSERFFKYPPNVKNTWKEDLKIIDNKLYLFFEYEEKENEYGVIPEKYVFIISDTLGNIIHNNNYFFEIQNTFPAFNNQKYIKTSDGGFLIAVTSGIYDLEKDVIENRSNYDSYAVKTDSTGKMEWFTKISTPDREEHINYMLEDSTGNYVIFNRVIPTGIYGEDGAERYMEIVKIKSPYSSVKNNVNNSEFSISPNPAEDYIEISLDGAHLEGGHHQNIEIYDVLGEPVPNMSTSVPSGHQRFIPIKSGQRRTIRVDVSNLPKGVYFVKIGNITEKFVKM